MKRNLICMTALLVAALALTGCATEPEPQASTSPTTGTATAQPSASSAPTEGTEPATTAPAALAMPKGAEDAETARQAAEELKDEVEQLSEVTDAKVVIAGTKAAVALKFDTQYQAGVTDRIREMVQERLDGILSGVTELYVTDDADMMERIAALSEQLENATDLTEIESRLSAILRQQEQTT